MFPGTEVAFQEHHASGHVVYNTWQNTVLKAGSEVSNALVLYNYSDEKSKIEQKRIEVLEKNVESTKELMGIAGSSYLEIIQAQSSLLNVQLSKVADDFIEPTTNILLGEI